jgi:formamidopyrimidine-DNA glycosylase
MPEVMEIRKYADFIKEYFLGKKLSAINIVAGRYKKHKPFELYDSISKNLPLKLLNVNTKGKFLYMTFEKSFYVLSTLGLSGGWAYQKSSTQISMPKLLEYIEDERVENYLLRSTSHINVEFIFSSEKLLFFDMLSFGTLKVITDVETLEKKLKTIGPDIMDESTDAKLFLQRVKTQLTQSIGTVLLNQKIISGVGNYIRADALWLAKINPFTIVKKLSDSELKKLFASLRVITWGNYDRKYAIKNNIIKSNSIVPADYKRDFFVYREKTDIYNNPVIKEELYSGSVKRFIYWVKKIQQ